MARSVTPPQLLSEEREAALRAFEEHLRQVPREHLDVEQMRWHCRITDPQGAVFVVAEYRLGQDGSVTRLWVLPDALWPVPHRSALHG